MACLGCLTQRNDQGRRDVCRAGRSLLIPRGAMFYIGKTIGFGIDLPGFQFYVCYLLSCKWFAYSSLKGRGGLYIEFVRV